MEPPHINKFEFLSAAEVEGRSEKYGLITLVLFASLIICAVIFLYLSFEFILNDNSYSTSMSIILFVIVWALISSARHTKAVSVWNQYCDVKQASELIKLAGMDEGIAFVLTNINALNRKPTVGEYQEIILVAQKSKNRKVFNELASLKMLASAKNDNKTNTKEADS